jgi:cobalt/nickel transport system permease protein
VSLAIVARNSLALLALLVLASVTPLLELLTALRRLGMPPVLVATLQFMCRYMYVLTDELDRMSKARRARTFRRSGRLDWGLLTGLIGVLFLRALERGERVHAAMLARGWDGTLRTLDPT